MFEVFSADLQPTSRGVSLEPLVQSFWDVHAKCRVIVYWVARLETWFQTESCVFPGMMEWINPGHALTNMEMQW